MKSREVPSVHSYPELLAKARMTQSVAYVVLPARVGVDASLTNIVPVGRESIVVRVAPVVEDLVDDLGDQLRSRLFFVVEEFCDLRLGYGDA